MPMSEIDPETMKNIKTALSITPKEELQSRVGEKLKNPIFYKAIGCPECDGSGYK